MLILIRAEIVDEKNGFYLYTVSENGIIGFQVEEFCYI